MHLLIKIIIIGPSVNGPFDYSAQFVWAIFMALLLTIHFHCMQNSSFPVPQKKENHSGLETHEGQ